MKQKINYRNAGECLHATYKDMEGMTLNDAVFILSEPVRKYHEAKSDKERINLPRPRMIKAYELLIDKVNQPDMREKVKEYISELDAEYDRCIDESESILAAIGDYDEKPMPLNYIKLVERAKTLMEVKNDLQGRLEELV